MFECSICYEICPRFKAVTECNHQFCAKCVFSWIANENYKRRCPLCRSEIKKATVRRCHSGPPEREWEWSWEFSWENHRLNQGNTKDWEWTWTADE